MINDLISSGLLGKTVCAAAYLCPPSDGMSEESWGGRGGGGRGGKLKRGEMKWLLTVEQSLCIYGRLTIAWTC